MKRKERKSPRATKQRLSSILRHYFKKFREAKPLLDKPRENPSNTAPRQNLAKADESLKAFNEEHGYPERWVVVGTEETSPKQDSRKVQPGKTRKGEPILARNPMRMGHPVFC